MSARSTLILLSFSDQGDMNFKIKSVCHVLYQSQYSHYIFVYQVLSCLYIRFCIFILLSCLEYSESFHISHLYDSGYLFLNAYHSLSRVIHICTYVSLAT